PERLDLPDEGARRSRETDPGEALGRLLLGLRTPQGGVLLEEPRREAPLDQTGQVALDGVRRRAERLDGQRAHAPPAALSSSVVTVSSSSSQDAANLSTPSVSSCSTTSV